MSQGQVRVNVISVLKACGNHVGNFSQLTRISPPPTSPSPTQLQSQVSGTRILPSSSSSSNPCLNLYFYRPMGSGIYSNLEFHETLTKQLLPLAWSHNPLTTLKLICNLLDGWKDGSKSDNEAFYAAAFGLRHNHPKTLACNLLPVCVSTEPRALGEGKVVNYSKNPQLHLVRGEDLKSKFSFMHSLEECEDWEVDLGKVFDFILEVVAVNENVKAEKMVRKVFVFTFFKQFSDGCWKPRGGDYEEIQRKFKEKGYAVPHLVIWNLISVGYAPWRTEEPGVTLFGGFSEAMLKCFLENDGQLDPDQVMELDISGQGYQTLAIFD